MWTAAQKLHAAEIAQSVIAEREVERVIEETIATYRGTGHPVKWCVGPWSEVPLEIHSHTRAITAEPRTTQAQHGIDHAITHARAATSAPILERLGFETIFRSSVHLLEAPRT